MRGRVIGLHSIHEKPTGGTLRRTEGGGRPPKDVRKYDPKERSLLPYRESPSKLKERTIRKMSVLIIV